jgi:hypothetical protein
MTEEFIKKYCLDCIAYRNEGYPNNPEHMCLKECGCSVNLINPTIKEMNKCPIGKGE